MNPMCWCATCHPNTVYNMRMILCPTCGDKRCPKATDHHNDCTGADEQRAWRSKHQVLAAAGDAIGTRTRTPLPEAKWRKLDLPPDPPGTYKCGWLMRWGSFWVGAHWSQQNKRLCVNPLPFVTFWITWPGGRTP